MTEIEARVEYEQLATLLDQHRLGLDKSPGGELPSIRQARAARGRHRGRTGRAAHDVRHASTPAAPRTESQFSPDLSLGHRYLSACRARKQAREAGCRRSYRSSSSDPIWPVSLRSVKKQEASMSSSFPPGFMTL
jgi:hypothetical protein